MRSLRRRFGLARRASVRAWPACGSAAWRRLGGFDGCPSVVAGLRPAPARRSDAAVGLGRGRSAGVALRPRGGAWSVAGGGDRLRAATSTDGLRLGLGSRRLDGIGCGLGSASPALGIAARCFRAAAAPVRPSRACSAAMSSGGMIDSGGAGRSNTDGVGPDQRRRHRADREAQVVHHRHRRYAAARLAVGGRRDRDRGGVRRHHRQCLMDVVERRGQPQAGEHHEEAAQKCRRDQAKARKHERSPRCLGSAGATAPAHI